MISIQPELVPLRSTLLSFRTNFFVLLLSHSFFSPSILPQRRCRDVKLTQINWAGIGRRGKTKRKSSHSSPKKRRSKVGWGWYQWQKEKEKGGGEEGGIAAVISRGEGGREEHLREITTHLVPPPPFSTAQGKNEAKRWRRKEQKNHQRPRRRRGLWWSKSPASRLSLIPLFCHLSPRECCRHCLL